MEMLGGQVLLVEADLSASLAQFRDAVEEEVGIFSGQQRLICIGMGKNIAQSVLMAGGGVGVGLL